MRLALAFGSTLLAAANAFPDKATAEDIQTALGDANSTCQSTPDPDGLVSFADERFTNWRHAAQDHCLQPEETPDSIGEDILKTVTDYMRRSARQFLGHGFVPPRGGDTGPRRINPSIHGHDGFRPCVAAARRASCGGG
jgi:hypothetical protein